MNIKRVYPVIVLLVCVAVFSVGCAKQHAYIIKEPVRDTIKTTGAKRVVYQRAFRAAQSLGFKPVGGIDKDSGIFNGARGDGFFEHSELAFVIEPGLLKVTVSSNKNSHEIMLNFVNAYNEEARGRGKGKNKGKGKGGR